MLILDAGTFLAVEAGDPDLGRDRPVRRRASSSAAVDGASVS
jgi:hypothetical protein